MLSRHMKILLSSTIVFLVLAAGVFWYVLKVKPLQKQISTLETSIKSELTLIEKYENGNVNKTEEEQDTVALQKKIPVVESVDQFLLLLEEAEVVSGSLIQQVTFSKSTEALIEKAAEESINDGGIAKTEETDTIKEPGLPEGLEKLTATLTVEAKNYFELEAFIRQVEKFERITNVESLQFTGFNEISNRDALPHTREKLTYNMTISTYYYPSLEELKDQAPNYEPQDPAEKKNPLYQGDVSDYLNGNIPSTTKYKVVEKNGVTYHIYSYEVKKGDTLFQLSVKYYNSRKGEDLIKSWNNLTQLETGTTIEIPVPTDSGI